MRVRAWLSASHLPVVVDLDVRLPNVDSDCRGYAGRNFFFRGAIVVALVA